MLNKFSINGRIRRRNYVLFALPFGILAYVSREVLAYSYDEGSIYFSFGVLFLIFVLSVILMIKRLHDIGMRGVNWLIILVPVLNVGFSFWLMIKEGESGANIYGNDPKGKVLK